MTTFQDLFKKSFLDKFMNGNLDFIHILFVLGVTLVMGLFMFAVYKKTSRSALYSHSFNLSLILISLITSMIILTISTNIVLSLGMVGALSIVRFRSAIKDPLDIVFLFWAIAVGIANGASLFEISVLGSAVISLVLFVMTFLKGGNSSYLLVLHYASAAENEVQKRLKELKKQRVKSRVIFPEKTELTVEVTLKKNQNADIFKISGIEKAVLIASNQE